MKNGIKDEIIKRLDDLPEEGLKEIFDFTNFLLERKRKETPNDTSQSSTKTDHDPLKEYIGGVSKGDLAKDIDRELYGRVES